MLRRIALGLVLALLVALPAMAQDPQKGVAAYEGGDYATALRELRPLAEKGNAEAQTYLGLMYRYGEGVPQNYVEAVKWYRKAAAQGHARAQNTLGNRYRLGQGVPQDYNEAAKWYRKAAEQGYAGAQYSLGISYDKGEGVPQNHAEALRWYRKAADQGHADAQNNLGSMYAKSQGVVTKAVKTPPKAKYGSQVPNTPKAIIAALPPAPARAGFRVQLGAVKSKARAEKEAVRLTRAHKSVLDGLKIVFVRADLGKRGVFYRLRAGPLSDRASADSLCRKLLARKQGCIVIKP